MEDDSHEQSAHQLTGYEPNAPRALGPADSASAPVHVRSMLMQELTIAPELLTQMNAWASQTAQSQQDAALLIQELFRRTQLLGEAVQQVPRSLCDQVREQLRADLTTHERHMIDLTGRVTALENLSREMVGKLSALQLEVSNQTLAINQVQLEQRRLDEWCSQLFAEQQQEAVSQNLGLTQDPVHLHGRVDALQDMMGHVASQLDELVAAHREGGASETPKARRPEHYTVFSPEVMSCSPPKADQQQSFLPELPEWPFPKRESASLLGQVKSPPVKSSGFCRALAGE